MTRKNRNLLVWFLGLLIINVVFALTGEKSSGVSFDENLFIVQDTSSIEQVQVGEVTLTRSGSDWVVNNKYAADHGLQRLLFSMLQRIKVKRPVEVEPKDIVKVSIVGGEENTFELFGNSTKTRTYSKFPDDDQVYEVHIPGYNEYLGGIFELNQDQWRDRLLVNATWRTVQNLSVKYEDPSAKNLEIAFDDQFFEVKGITPIDSNYVVEYLNQFEYFQVNEWVSTGRYPQYDSLVNTPSMATIQLESINESMPLEIKVFKKLPGDRFYIAKSSGQMFVIDERRMQNILKRPENFKYQEVLENKL